MKSNQSAGILLYRLTEEGVQVLLVHPGGPYHVNKDKGAWSVPKGVFDDDEDALAAARREFFEETGQELKAERFLKLTPVKQKAGKTVFAWAAEGNIDIESVESNTFRMEYPYRSGKWIDVPEVDKAEWFTPDAAKEKINPAQVSFIDELLVLLTHERKA